MANGPAPFSETGKRARDLLYKDYNFDHKFIFSVPNSTGLGLTATGLKKDQFFVGDISGLYKSGNVAVDVKVDTHNNVSTKVTLNDVFHSKKVALSFNIPDHKSGKLDVQYLHPHAAIDSSIDLNPAPRLELSAAIGSKDISIGGEVGFNTTSASFTKYNAGIAFNKPDFSATLMLADKGEALKASYIHYVDRPDELTVAAELAHKLSSSENRFTIGTSQLIDPKTVLKTRFSDDGKAAFQCQRAWRPNSLITLSAEYNSTKIFGSPAKFGLALSLKP
ncbi:mitochondrial outer membrane protein porin 6 [Trifolium pratense]|uniref:mitochondrial outer membrane protein porin 6 n=1 Tax=Trifolium pratense TaxID=57577 RepID=UPI001E692FD0|nr:mitochondrial outer membrane protein porin 6 [Trifolium pratense]XP_045812949.1 mitochondrial outer membrane protein porin 6 [Trifolium pratense]